MVKGGRVIKCVKEKHHWIYTGCVRVCVLLSHVRWQEYDWQTPRSLVLVTIPTMNSIDSSPLRRRFTRATTNEIRSLRLWLNTPKPGSHQFWYLSHILHVFRMFCRMDIRMLISCCCGGFWGKSFEKWLGGVSNGFEFWAGVKGLLLSYSVLKFLKGCYRWVDVCLQSL